MFFYQQVIHNVDNLLWS